MIHTTTKNNSAKKMYMYFRDSGRKNSTFHLQLFDKNLLNVDPTSDDLTPELKLRIYNEITINPWYFIREVVRLDTGGTKLMFEFHRGNIALIWCLLNNLSSYVLWPRQCYKTTSIAILYTWFLYFGTKNTNAILYAITAGQGVKNLGAIRDLKDSLPHWLIAMVHDKKDKENTTDIKSHFTGNWFRTAAAPNSIERAKNANRGFSTQFIWNDEIAFITYISDMMDAIIPSYETVMRIAKANNSYYHKIYSTTAGYLNTDSGQYAFRVLKDCAEFTEELYDEESLDAIHNYVYESSKNGMISLEYMWYDLGKPDNFLEEMSKSYTNSANPQDAIAREILNEWLDVSTSHPLGQKRASVLLNARKKTKQTLLVNGLYRLKLYVKLEDIDPRINYIGAMDLSGNLENDFSTLTIIDPRDFGVVATLRTNAYSTTRFTHAIYEIMTNIFTSMVLVAERNNMGGTIIQLIEDLLGEDESEFRIYYAIDGKPGVHTDAKKRNELYYGSIIRTAVDNHLDRIRDNTILEEMRYLIFNKKGNVDHKSGFHDDQLISYLIALWFLMYATNKDKYMDVMTILTKVHGDTKLDSLGINVLNKRKINTIESTISPYDTVLLGKKESRVDDSFKLGNMDFKDLSKLKSLGTVSKSFNSMDAIGNGMYNLSQTTNKVHISTDTKVVSDEEDDNDYNKAMFEARVEDLNKDKNLHLLESVHGESNNTVYEKTPDKSYFQVDWSH